MSMEESNMIFHFYFVFKLSKFLRETKRGQMIPKVHLRLSFRRDVFATTIMWAKRDFIQFLTILRFVVAL